MKKISISIYMIFITGFCFGQSDQVENTSYDSTQNFLGKEVNKYLGQELYLKGKAESSRPFGYEGFYTDYKKGKDNIMILKNPLSDNGVYKCCYFFNSRYDSLAGKYFKVLEIIKHPKAEEDKSLYGTKSYLKLQEKTSDDIVYYEYDNKFYFNFPFIVVGFFEKLKKKCIGQSYVYGKKSWECTDIIVEEEYYNLSMILKDKNRKTITVEYSHLLTLQKN
jgi:hypothetical protein